MHEFRENYMIIRNMGIGNSMILELIFAHIIVYGIQSTIPHRFIFILNSKVALNVTKDRDLTCPNMKRNQHLSSMMMPPKYLHFNTMRLWYATWHHYIRNKCIFHWQQQLLMSVSCWAISISKYCHRIRYSAWNMWEKLSVAWNAKIPFTAQW